MTSRQLLTVVMRAQRRTASRVDAHRLLCSEIEGMALGLEAETAIRDAVYRLLHPEHADKLAPHHRADESVANPSGGDQHA